MSFKTKNIPFVPMSGFKGDNLIEEFTNMPWYSRFTVKPKKKEVSGKTLLNALNDIVHVPKRPTKKPLRMPVSGVYKIKGVGDVITGRVEQGTLKPGPNVVFAPTGVSGKCFSIGNKRYFTHYRISVNEVGPLPPPWWGVHLQVRLRFLKNLKRKYGVNPHPPHHGGVCGGGSNFIY